jgi:hypothetical protein
MMKAISEIVLARMQPEVVLARAASWCLLAPGLYWRAAQKDVWVHLLPPLSS